jgi:1,4-alpha-glucan branching enzyme
MDAGPAMGATPHDSGTIFRVWAPFARAVSVAGDFNGWSADASPLTRENDGRWSADVPEARAGHEYRYVVSTADGQRSRIDPYAREVTNSAGNGIIRSPDYAWGDTPYRTPSWDELVIYELHVGTFNDSPGSGPGSFQSVINRMDYLQQLGVNAIEIMPSAEFAADFSWGYNPSHIFAIEQAYGGPTALKDLVRAAHDRGIAVIFDVVYNHFGPSDLDLWQFDGWSENGKGGIYFYNDRRSRTPWGDTRPDYGRAEVVAFLQDNARQWLEEFRFDGLRWDATAYIRNVDGGEDAGNDIPDGWRMMQSITAETDARQPWKLHIAEDLQRNEWLTRPVADGGAGFDSQWDAAFVHPVRAVLSAMADGERDMHDLRSAIAGRYGGDAFRRVIYTESHDEVANGKTRLPEAIWPGNAGSWHSRKRSTLGAVLAFTAPGIPMIFQGQEILEDQWFHDDDPIDWSKEQTYGGILQLYRDLMRLRRDWYGTTRGLRGQGVHVHHVNDDDNVIAFHRWHAGGPEDDVIVVVNVANRSYDDYRIGMPRQGEWRLRFNSDWNGYSLDFGTQASFDTAADSQPRDAMPFSASVGIGPYSALILSQDR